MRFRSHCDWRRMLAVWCFSAVWCVAAQFVMPAEGPVPFRRDRLPMDADSMGSLAGQLLVLAGGQVGRGPAELRSAAQMLAVAAVLRPGDDAVVATARALRSGGVGSGMPSREAVRVCSRIWQRIRWLGEAAAGVDGNALAACLQDAMLVADPEHPRSKELRGKGERGAWSGWVAPLAAFEGKVAPGTEVPLPVAGPRFLESATVGAVMWVARGSGGSKSWVMEPAALGMKAVLGEGAPGVSIDLGPVPMSANRLDLADRIKKALRPFAGGFPKPLAVSITSPEFEKSLQSGGAMSVGAAAAVLAGSALTAREPHGMILGRVEPDGSYQAGAGFWEQLRALAGKGKGRRLIVPASAARDVLSLLVVNEVGYFLDYEILAAKDLADLLELAALPEEAPLESPCGRFRVLRKRAPSRDLAGFLSDEWVRNYLEALTRIGPYHLSAKALHDKARGENPFKLTRPVLVSEVRRVMRPLDFVFTAWDPNDIRVLRSIDKLGSDCSDELEKVSRIADFGDVEFVKRAQQAIDAMRGAARDQRKSIGNWQPGNLEGARRGVADHYRNFLGLMEKEAPSLSAP